MLALSPSVYAPLWQMVRGLIPAHVPAPHPLGCHRPRIADDVCFKGILARLVTGCSWEVAGTLSATSESTLRRRFREWNASGVFARAVEEALAAYDTVIGFRLDDTAIDASLHKAPTGGEASGPNPYDRAKLGWKWSVMTEAAGVPIGWTFDSANRHDSRLLAPTLDAVSRRGLLCEVDLVRLDRGYSYPAAINECTSRGLTVEVPKKRPRGKTGQGRRAKGNRRHGYKTAGPMRPEPGRWQVERTNSWMSNFGQLRRNTDRRARDRAAQLDLAITCIIVTKLVKHAKRYNAITRAY